jgi:hypothetical protein
MLRVWVDFHLFGNRYGGGVKGYATFAAAMRIKAKYSALRSLLVDLNVASRIANRLHTYSFIGLELRMNGMNTYAVGLSKSAIRLLSG